MKGYRVTVIGFLTNIILFVVKIVAGMMSNSIAIISDALNSLSDTIASIGVLYTVKVSEKSADKDHPFGHTRAQPIGGLIVAIFAGVLGFEVIISSVKRVITSEVIIFSNNIILLVIGSLILKSSLAYFFNKNKINNPAIKASYIDARNDVFLTLIVIIGYMFGGTFDAWIGAFMGIFIIKSGYNIALENIDYLMGSRPEEDTMKEIKDKLKLVKDKDIKNIKNIKAHYVGNFVHIALTVVVNRRLSTKRSHDIATKIQKKLTCIPSVDKVFVHVDYK